jgi:UDP-N-acetylmuramate dehydrogenase
MMAAMKRQQEWRGDMSFDEPMAKHTSWRAGGCADRYYQPADLQDLSQFISGLPGDEALLWTGLGSNLLVRDGGFRGTVIATQGRLQEMELVDETLLRVEAGVSCAKVARFCSRKHLSGLEFLAGIPGAMGGALAMNAGAFGGETWEHLVSAEMMDRKGNIHVRARDEFNVGYRHVSGPADEWFVAGIFRLQPDPEGVGQERIRALLEQRNTSQPVGVFSCGSVFKNPESDHAARLIDSCGLKETCVGGACVSGKHANFIINSQQATAKDIESLIGLVRDIVHKQTGVLLEPEVRIVGEAAEEEE